MIEKPTPGPWHVLEVACGPTWVMGPTPNSVYVARMGHGSLPNRPEELADARLIAAAPELYAVCGRLTSYGLMHCPDPDPAAKTGLQGLINEARAILAKVEGKQCPEPSPKQNG